MVHKHYTCFKPLSVPIAVHFMYFGPSLRDHLYQRTTFSIFIGWSLKDMFHWSKNTT